MPRVSNSSEEDLEKRKRHTVHLQLIVAIIVLAGAVAGLVVRFGPKVVGVCFLFLLLVVSAAFGLRKLASPVVSLSDASFGKRGPHRRTVLAARWLLLVSALTLLSIALGPRGYRAWRRLHSDTTVILVADFIGPEARFHVTDMVVQSLRQITTEYKDLRVQYLGDSISERMGSEVARSLGERENANVVLWGWYLTMADSIRATLHVEVLNEPLFVGDSTKSEDTWQSPDFGGFVMQVDISSRARYITLLVSGLVHYRNTDYAGAIERFSDALAESGTRSEIIDPAPVYFYRAVSHLMRGDFDAAITDYDSALQRSARSVAYVGRGVAYANKGLMDRAIVDFDSAISLNSALEFAYSNRAEAFIHKRMPDRAIADLDTLIAHHPRDLWAHIERGRAYSLAGDLDRAIVDLDWAIAAQPTAEAYFYRGRVYAKRNLEKQAIADYDRAIALTPWNLSAWLNRGNAYARSGEYERALRDFDTALARNSTWGPVYLSRAETHFAMRHPDLAISDYTAAIVHGERSAEVFWKRARSYALLNLPERVIEDCTIAIAISPSVTEAYHLRAMAFAFLGRKNEAIRDLMVVLRQASDPAILEEARQLLDTLNRSARKRV